MFNVDNCSLPVSDKQTENIVVGLFLYERLADRLAIQSKRISGGCWPIVEGASNGAGIFGHPYP